MAEGLSVKSRVSLWFGYLFELFTLGFLIRSCSLFVFILVVWPSMRYHGHLFPYSRQPEQ